MIFKFGFLRCFSPTFVPLLVFPSALLYYCFLVRVLAVRCAFYFWRTFILAYFATGAPFLLLLFYAFVV